MSTITSTSMSELPTLLRSLRKEHRLTLKEAANLAGISFTFLSEVELGRTNPSLDTLSKLAGVYRVVICIVIGEATA